MKQQQFLNLATAEEAEERFWEAVQPQPLGEELVMLEDAHGRILACDIVARHNVPYFDRSNFDGFALRAEDTFGAQETAPILLTLNPEILACGVVPQEDVAPGTATTISTGGVLPRGADGVVMIENTFPFKNAEPAENMIQVLKPIVPNAGVSLAGSDIGAGEVVLRIGELLGYRETGTLAALGEANVSVWRRPKVAVISTGDELIAPGEQMEMGKVYDSNSTVIAHAVEELGCEAVRFGIVPDDEAQLETVLRKALALDFVLLSGGTSKGEGDLNYRVFEKFRNPGVLVHGVSLKPGKPLCLAVLDGIPAAILPGFPTSSTFTFSKFIAPVLRKLAGLTPERSAHVQANVPLRLNSDKGRTEFNLVHLVRNEDGFSAYSTGKGSGSITGFARADGFMEIPRTTEMLEAGEDTTIHLLGESTRPSDLMIIGSHCVGLDFLLGEMQKRGVSCKFLAVGSMGGILAAQRGECDLAGTHLLDEASNQYNSHLLTAELALIKGYRRSQGLLFRKDDSRFALVKQNFQETIRQLMEDQNVRMINRNLGSGTRVLLDRLLAGQRPSGFFQEAKSHNSVAAAITHKRADWGIAIRSVAEDSGLDFFPMQDEEYDFIIPNKRLKRQEVRQFINLLQEANIQTQLNKLGLSTDAPV
ncbi:MAG: molybdopterin biosynthesis protein [SAR324 cluster bacterium]|jgi:putative molybdopterin biosynthesis protein|uniref:MoaB/Mog domain-containing protein n=1 Tax=marine metagenome TaxID=408172 RepID=A0A381RDF2_9ZZZZ|nr:molybdopterin biosynthesis protein [SAR324 cluster bacterium]HCV44877.1 molybdopterin biosynthesis protein [Deltaproteobacteria bacterium]